LCVLNRQKMHFLRKGCEPRPQGVRGLRRSGEVFQLQHHDGD